MSDELLTASEVARRVAAETGRPVRPVKVGILAQRGRIPVAARGKGGSLKLSDRAVTSMLAYERARNGGD